MEIALAPQNTNHNEFPSYWIFFEDISAAVSIFAVCFAGALIFYLTRNKRKAVQLLWTGLALLAGFLLIGSLVHDGTLRGDRYAANVP